MFFFTFLKNPETRFSCCFRYASAPSELSVNLRLNNFTSDTGVSIEGAGCKNIRNCGVQKQGNYLTFDWRSGFGNIGGKMKYRNP